MSTVTEKQLVVDNSNGKVQHDDFIVLHLAPPEDFHTVYVANTVFVIKTDAGLVYARLTGFMRLLMSELTFSHTYWDNGCNVGLWKCWFKKKHPQVNEQTKMAVYFYEKVK